MSIWFEFFLDANGYLQHGKYYHLLKLQHISNGLAVRLGRIYLVFGHRSHTMALETDEHIPNRTIRKKLTNFQKYFPANFQFNVNTHTYHKKCMEILQNWVHFNMKYPFKFYLLHRWKRNTKNYYLFVIWDHCYWYHTKYCVKEIIKVFCILCNNKRDRRYTFIGIYVCFFPFRHFDTP